MPTWPGSLPTIALRDSYQELTQSGAAIRTNMDVGPPKQRNRYTATIKPYRVIYDMTGTQLDTFWTFYRSTLGNGALSFDGLPHPRTQVAMTARFDVDNPPQVVPTGPDNYNVSLSVEELP